MANTAAGFDGTLTEVQESNIKMRASELAYRHGVWSGGDVTPGTGRAVNVSALDSLIAGIWALNDATSVTLAANAGTKSRIDYIVATADWVANTVTIAAVQGTAAANPVAPNLTQTVGGTWQMPLARVTVRGGATTIAAADIEVAAPVRMRSKPYTTSVNTDSMRGSATAWNTLGNIVVPDLGRPVRLQVSAAVRFNATETGGYMAVRVLDADTNAVYGEGITPWLQGSKSMAVVSAQISPSLTGTRRVRLEMLPVEVGAGEVIQVLDHPSNHFTVLPLPA